MVVPRREGERKKREGKNNDPPYVDTKKGGKGEKSPQEKEKKGGRMLPKRWGGGEWLKRLPQKKETKGNALNPTIWFGKKKKKKKNSGPGITNGKG